MRRQRPKAEIFNTDQGSQFTSRAFTGLLLENGIRISMDGKGWMQSWTLHQIAQLFNQGKRGLKALLTLADA